MNSFSKLATVAFCGAALAACNAVEDVRSAPTYPVPAELVVVNGTVTGVGLSNTRPVVLEDQGQKRCTPPNAPSNYNGELVYCTYSVQGTSVLRFGGLPKGAPYNIVVKSNPYNRVCTIVNGTGVATEEVNNVELNCARDATPLYTVTTNIPASIANNLPPGFKVTLTTEEGTETIAPAAGQTQVVFTKPIFNNGSSLPIFAYAVTATTQSPGGPVNSCSVNSVSGGGATGTNVAATGTLAPTGNVVTAVGACLFTISGRVLYSQAPQLAYTAQTITGLQLGLRPNGSDTILGAPLNITFDATTATTSQVYSFPALPSNSSALYEVTVVTQPTGMFCTVANGGVASLQTLPLWVNGTVTTPATQPTNIGPDATAFGVAPVVTSVQIPTVRCRNVPAPANQLEGTYQLIGQRATLTAGANATLITMGSLEADGVGTTTITGITATSPGTISATNTTTISDDRKYLTFFANGTFLYGVHTAATTTSTNGVEHGFYSYDPANKRIFFSITSDTNNNSTSLTNSLLSGISSTVGLCTTTSTPVSCPSGIITLPSTTPAASPMMTLVEKAGAARKTLTATFGSGTVAAFGTNRIDWAMIEPVQTPGQIEGAWVTADSKRLFIFSKSTFAPGMHVGVNGAANMQDACFQIEDPTLAASFYTRRGGDAGCNPGGVVQLDANGNPVRDANNNPVIVGGAVGTVDIPVTASVPTSTAAQSIPTILPGFLGRLPGSLSTGALAPVSPTYYTVTPGTPDTLKLQETLNDVSVRAPVEFKRSLVN